MLQIQPRHHHLQPVHLDDWWSRAMNRPDDSNAAIWKSTDIIAIRTARAGAREQRGAAQWELMAQLLPFDESDAFIFLDLGAGTGSASHGILKLYPHSTAILADFSAEMIAAGEVEMQPFAGRYRFVTFDMCTDVWPKVIPRKVDAVITGMSIHHLPDDRKRGLFSEIFDRLRPGGWYLNYDAVDSEDAAVRDAWSRANDRIDPLAAEQRLHRTAIELARHTNHMRYVIPLTPQLAWIEDAGFAGVDVYWKRLDNVIYGGMRPEEEKT
ncbi:class I SAM-dependent methyltransferase [Cryobacterium cheniae]|nr:class I SAM-dependent methyltransferase [Cryobacterium cheniae]